MNTKILIVFFSVLVFSAYSSNAEQSMYITRANNSNLNLADCETKLLKKQLREAVNYIASRSKSKALQKGKELASDQVKSLPIDLGLILLARFIHPAGWLLAFRKKDIIRQVAVKAKDLFGDIKEDVDQEKQNFKIFVIELDKNRSVEILLYRSPTEQLEEARKAFEGLSAKINDNLENESAVSHREVRTTDTLATLSAEFNDAVEQTLADSRSAIHILTDQELEPLSAAVTLCADENPINELSLIQYLKRSKSGFSFSVPGFKKIKTAFKDYRQSKD